MSLTAIINPETFFSERDGEYRLLVPLLAIVGVFVLAIASGIVEMVMIPEMPTDPNMTAEEQEIASAVSGAFGVVGIIFSVIWLLVVVVFYFGTFLGLTSIFDGEGSAKATLAVLGWGFVPKLVHEFVRLLESVYRAYLFQTADMLTLQSGIGIVGNLLVVLVAFAMLGWSAYIWFHGLQAARNVDRRGAAISVGVPVVIAAIWAALATLFRLLGSAGV